LTDIQKSYTEYFDKIGNTTITTSAQEEILKRPQSWNRFYELAILNSIERAELSKSERRIFQDYFQDSHERISLISLETVVKRMEGAGVQLTTSGEDLILSSNEMDKETLLKWLVDLFPKYG
jgi:hypothetical protein